MLDFGLRWQGDSPRRSAAKTGAATPLFAGGQSFQSGEAFHFPPQSKFLVEAGSQARFCKSVTIGAGGFGSI
jgi:hypothetical protein